MASRTCRSQGRRLIRPRDPAAGRPVSRRHFIEGAAASLFVAPAILKGIRADAAEINGNLFALGVASGDPDDRSVVIWTRLAPAPLDGGGMPARPVAVRWQVATDYGMANVIRQGGAIAWAANGHAVRVLVDGLPSDSWLFYRFQALGEYSRVGRTRTFPAPADAADRMRFALASCQDYRAGFYTAWRDMLADDAPEAPALDFVVFVGDYIYEAGPRGTPIIDGRNHTGGEAFSPVDYRNRYALYRLDLDLQEAHARFPFIVTWDDHECDNNYAGWFAEEGAPYTGIAFLLRRWNAYRVYCESMPLRPGDPGLGFRLYRKLAFGTLADIHVLDTRRYRSDQPAADQFGSTDPASLFYAPLFALIGDPVVFDAQGILDPAATMLGAHQELWLAANLWRSQATWNVLAQQVMMTEWNLAPLLNRTFQPHHVPAVRDFFMVDAWDGYPAARRRLFDVLAAVRPANPVVLTGDIHSAWGANLLDDFADPESDILAAEFVCSSISSAFALDDPRLVHAVARASVAEGNPHVEYFNGLYRGYCLCEVDRQTWRTTYRAVGTPADALDPDPLALIPFPDTIVETDAVLEIAAGFNAPASGARLATTFARANPI